MVLLMVLPESVAYLIKYAATWNGKGSLTDIGLKNVAMRKHRNIKQEKNLVKRIRPPLLQHLAKDGLTRFAAT